MGEFISPAGNMFLVRTIQDGANTGNADSNHSVRDGGDAQLPSGGTPDDQSLAVQSDAESLPDGGGGGLDPGHPANRTIVRQEGQVDMSRFVELTKTYNDIRVGLRLYFAIYKLPG